MSEPTAVEETKTEARQVAAPRMKGSRSSGGRDRSLMWRFIHLFGSLKMAMWLFVVLIVACAVGTVYESRFDAQIARYYIYEAPWFTLWLILLCITLACAAFTRLPWKKRHTGFVVTHLGIIVLLIGAMIGRHFGTEGSITLRVGEGPARHMVTQEMALNFWGPDGDLYLVSFPVNLNPPSERSPHTVPLDTSDRPNVAASFQRAYTNLFRLEPREPALVFDRFSENLEEEISLIEQPGSGNPGVQLTLSSSMMGGEEIAVILQERPANRSFHNMEGLAQIVLVDRIQSPEEAGQGGMPLLQVLPDGNGRIEYSVADSGGETEEGVLEAGESLETGWADWTLTLEKVYAEAEYRQEVYEVNGSSGDARVPERGLTGVRGWLTLGDGSRSEPRWFIAGETETVQAGGEVVRFGFGNRREPLPFTVELIDFDVPRDPGTENPAGFVSTLVFRDPDTGEEVTDTAGMNHPAMFPPGFHRALTGNTYKFSQAHWEPDDLNLSVVQVLHDPGWLLKWIGSLIIIAGIFIIFYVRPYRNRRPEDAIDEALGSKKDREKVS